MARELRKTGGIGANIRYEVTENDRVVGEIARKGDKSVWIRGHYGELLASADSFEEARSKALSMDFPSKENLYETICARVSGNRSSSLERSLGPRLARLARDVLSGSNTARADLQSLLENMNALALDRKHSTRSKTATPTPGWKTEFLMGKPVKWDQHMDCEYPDPPDLFELSPISEK